MHHAGMGYGYPAVLRRAPGGAPAVFGLGGEALCTLSGGAEAGAENADQLLSPACVRLRLLCARPAQGGASGDLAHPDPGPALAAGFGAGRGEDGGLPRAMDDPYCARLDGRAGRRTDGLAGTGL